MANSQVYRDQNCGVPLNMLSIQTPKAGPPDTLMADIVGVPKGAYRYRAGLLSPYRDVMAPGALVYEIPSLQCLICGYR